MTRFFACWHIGLFSYFQHEEDFMNNIVDYYKAFFVNLFTNHLTIASLHAILEMWPTLEARPPCRTS